MRHTLRGWTRCTRRFGIAGAVASLLLSPVVLSTDLAAQQLACKGVDSVTAPKLDHVKRLLIAQDSGSAAFRAGLGIAGVDSSAVIVVADSVTCTAVTNSVLQAFGKTDPPVELLFVLKVGNRYVALFPRQSPWESLYFVDSGFGFIGVAP